MSDFKKQIEEDIREYQENYKYISNIQKDEWAFNYWVLDKLFYEDEELVEEKIVDYHDLGIDAYEIYEDTKDIFLIQNKYYGETTAITAEYVKNDFLLRAITALENGTYKKSDELQGAFSKYKDSADFTVYLQLFVTNNIHNREADEYVKKFNVSHPKYIAKIFYLDDIEERYYGETQQVKKNISVKVESVNKGTILNINTEIPKVSYNIKLPFNKKIDKRKYSLYLYIIFACLFDDTSELDEKLKKDNIITSSIYFNLLNCDTHILISLINETKKYDELLDNIKSTLSNIKINEEDFERKKKVLISNELFLYDNIEVVNEMIIDNILFDNKLIDNIIPIIKELNYNELSNVIESLNLDNTSIVILKK